MFFKNKNVDAEKILSARLAAEVEYLRDQNAKLVDRILAIFDSKTYVDIKQIEARDEQIKTQKIRVEKMTSEDFTKELAITQEENAKQKVLNMQLSQMMTGNEVM